LDHPDHGGLLARIRLTAFIFIKTVLCCQNPKIVDTNYLQRNWKKILNFYGVLRIFMQNNPMFKIDVYPMDLIWR